MKITLLEDNIDFANIFIKKLKRDGFEVKYFQNIDSFHFTESDLYIVDLQIYSEQSYCVIEEIRKHTNKPIILLTGTQNSCRIQEAFDKGVDFYMDKMIRPGLLKYQLEAIIGLYKRLC